MALTAKRPSRAKEHLLHEVTSDDEPKKRLNVVVEQSLYSRMKRRAVDDQESISEITRRLWIEYLSK